MTEQEFWAILAAMPEPLPLFYRLYYHDDGSPLCYSMEDLPGNYIEIDAETFAAADHWVRVVDGKIKRINRSSSQKLVRTKHGTSCHPCNVAVIMPDSGTNWSKQIYGLDQD